MDDFDDGLDESLLLALPLEYPYSASEPTPSPVLPVLGSGVSHVNDTDSGVGSHDGKYNVNVLFLLYFIEVLKCLLQHFEEIYNKFQCWAAVYSLKYVIMKHLLYEIL